MINYKISGGTLGNSGGAITGQNYVKLCGSATSISGSVYQSDGTTPITGDSNLKVELYEHNNPNNFVQAVSVSTVDSTYSLGGLAPGNYDLRVHADNFIDEFWGSEQSVYYRYQADTITLVTDQELTNINFQLDQGTPLTGTIYDSDGTTPLNGILSDIAVCSHVDQSCGTMWDFCSIVREDGTYSIRLPQGTFYAHTFSTDYISEWWATPSSERDCAHALPITINEDAPISGIDLQLEESVTISGTIFQSDGFTPITSDPLISLGLVKDNPCSSQGSVAGGPIFNDGTFSYPIEPGTYYLRVGTANYVDEWWATPASVHSCSLAQVLTVGTTDITNISFQLAPGNIIAGSVYRKDGTTLYTNNPSLWINALTRNPCSYNYDIVDFSTHVDTSFGTYSIHVPDGAYYILANTGDHPTNEWWAETESVDVNSCDQTQLLSVSGTDVYSDKNFQLGGSDDIGDACEVKVMPWLMLLFPHH